MMTKITQEMSDKYLKLFKELRSDTSLTTVQKLERLHEYSRKLMEGEA